jgi:hypothetical protein
MADYHPLIARAVAGLERNTGDARRALYERARTALVAQLRGVTPALSESDVTRERLALEEAIRKVEAESARQTLAEPAPQKEPSRRVRAPEMPRWDSSSPAASERPSSPERPSSAPPLTSRNDSLARKPMPRQSSNLAPNPMLGEERYVDPVFDQPLTSPQAKAQPQPVPPPQRHPLRGRPASERTSDERPGGERPSERPAAGDRRSLLDSGLAGLRNALAESSELGKATARSLRSARENYADVAPSAREFDRSALNIPEGRGQDDMLRDGPMPRMLEPALDDETQPVPSRIRMSPLAVGEEESGRPKRKGAGGTFVKILLVLLLLGGLAGTLWVLWSPISQLYSSLRSPTPVEVAAEPTVSTPPNRTKIPERFGPSGQPTVTPAPQPTNTAPAGAAVAQRVVLYEEDPNDPQGKRFVGSAIWRTETVSPGPGQAAEVAVRADVEIPERRIAMTWSLRRNSDPNLPASHTVEIMFRLPQDFPSGGVSNVPGILMKQAEQSRGTPLSGLAVKVTTGFFLIGLSSTEADRERNVQLLKERAWFDIPVVYGNNRRAILALEKGTPGERAFEEAFKAWKQ